MNTTLMGKALNRINYERPPVWFMRQAGRYHSHYQELKKRYTFEELCKIPKVACEATMGPVEDFGFDSAILFSDLLFPLDVLGMGLTYEVGPKLKWHLNDLQDLKKLTGGKERGSELGFQADALKLIRERLSPEKTLLGFVGGPWTLFCYAVEGSHQGNLISSKTGLMDGRHEGFFEILGGLLVQNMILQAQSGADAVCVLDTCAGELDPMSYADHVVPHLKMVMQEFKKVCPSTPIVYYSKGTGPSHWRKLSGLPISGLGVDWRHEITEVLKSFGDQWAIQGNIDPAWLFLDERALAQKLARVFGAVKELPEEKRRGWICGLGHGVLPKTPESNVRLFLKMQSEYFGGVTK